MLQSCSSGTDSNNDSSNILCKKQVLGTFVFDYIYNGNKIERTIANGQLAKRYYYTGDLITKIEDYIDNQLRITTTLTYNNNQLITQLTIIYPDPATPYEPQSGLKTNYTYNLNNTISFVKYSGTPSVQNIIQSTGLITLINGEINTVQENNSGTKTHTYDKQNSPFKNVLGANKLIPYPFTPCDFSSREHNLISITSPNINLTYSYQYNNQGYPISRIQNSGNNAIVSKYYY